MTAFVSSSLALWVGLLCQKNLMEMSPLPCNLPVEQGHVGEKVETLELIPLPPMGASAFSPLQSHAREDQVALAGSQTPSVRLASSKFRACL